MLERFIRLHRQTDNEIRDYASKWGPLGICRHGRPHTHWPLSTADITIRRLTEAEREAARGRPPDATLPCFRLVEIAAQAGNPEVLAGLSGEEAGAQLVLETEREFCQPLGHVQESSRGGLEPLEGWRFYSEEAALILMTAASLHAEGTGWTRVKSRVAERLLYGPKSSSESDALTDVDWRWVRGALDRWLGLGNVRPYLHDAGDGVLSVGYGTADAPVESDLYVGRHGFFFENICGLFGALATQLLLAATNERGWTNCHNCGLPFFVDRAPARGKRAWCWDEACRKAKDAQAKRNRRKKPPIE